LFDKVIILVSTIELIYVDNIIWGLSGFEVPETISTR